jgi:23S rRNA (uracil1939-C5)-methyltransferase
MTQSPARCAYFQTCNACQYWHLDYKYQTKTKISELKTLLGQNGLHFTGPIDFISCGEYGLRDRIDFTFKYNSETGEIESGFYDKNKKLIAIKECLQVSPELQTIFKEFTSIKPIIGSEYVKRGSVRLRRGPEGLKGCWLDLSNLDIKSLLDDETYLRSLLKLRFKVEIGQKGKSLEEVNGKLKLTDPLPRRWFKTIDDSGREIPLYCLISDFTQPSVKTAEALTKIVLDWVENSGFAAKKSILEFGAGIGQFTSALLASGHEVTALEVDSSAYESLRLNTQSHEDSLKIYHDDFHRRSIEIKSSVVLVNPARSGLKNFVGSIAESQSKFLIYISCFPESMCEDLAKLKERFVIKDIKIVDQFPQTRHFESCVFLERIK